MVMNYNYSMSRYFTGNNIPNLDTMSKLVGVDLYKQYQKNGGIGFQDLKKSLRKKIEALKSFFHRETLVIGRKDLANALNISVRKLDLFVLIKSNVGKVIQEETTKENFIEITQEDFKFFEDNKNNLLLILGYTSNCKKRGNKIVPYDNKKERTEVENAIWDWKLDGGEVYILSAKDKDGNKQDIYIGYFKD